MKVTARKAFYLKLGTRGGWEQNALQNGVLKARYAEVSHELALSGDTEQIRQAYIKQGKSSGIATSFANQLLTFYQAPEDALWITFANGCLYWCFAKQDVHHSEKDPLTGEPSRSRQTLDGWHNRSRNGRLLETSLLPGALTRTEGYQQAICGLKPDVLEQLLMLINDEVPPLQLEAQQSRATVLATIEKLIQQLHWKDFEALADILFTKSGWQRVNRLGGAQKTIDLELEHIFSNERAIVQVKSQTNQAQLDEYIGRLGQWSPEFKKFYVYHSVQGKPLVTDDTLTLMDAARLAELVLATGMYDWVMQRVT